MQSSKVPVLNSANFVHIMAKLMKLKGKDEPMPERLLSTAVQNLTFTNRMFLE
jgi:hypothetical protein